MAFLEFVKMKFSYAYKTRSTVRLLVIYFSVQALHLNLNH